MKLLKNDGYNDIKLLLPGLDSMNGEYQKIAERLEIQENVNDVVKEMGLAYNNDNIIVVDD